MRADGHDVTPEIAKHGGDLDVTAEGVFRAARSVTVRLSCAH
jgi:hypothetical protein